jgi:hypothetical protein
MDRMVVRGRGERCVADLRLQNRRLADEHTRPTPPQGRGPPDPGDSLERALGRRHRGSLPLGLAGGRPLYEGVGFVAVTERRVWVLGGDDAASIAIGQVR